MISAKVACEFVKFIGYTFCKHPDHGWGTVQPKIGKVKILICPVVSLMFEPSFAYPNRDEFVRDIEQWMKQTEERWLQRTSDEYVRVRLSDFYKKFKQQPYELGYN